MLEESQILLCLQEMDLKVRELILVFKLGRGMHPTDGWDLLTELAKAHTRVDRINGECPTEAEHLSQRVMWISNVLVNLGVLPVEDIPQTPMFAREVLPTVDLILKH
jgi:hypothetical protein